MSFNGRLITPEPWFEIRFNDCFLFAAPGLDMLNDPHSNSSVKSLLLYHASSERLRVLLRVVDDRHDLINFVIPHEPNIHMD